MTNDGFKLNGIVLESPGTGDPFNIKGERSHTFRERHLKAKGSSVELFPLSRGLSFGIRKIEIMLILW